MRKVLIAAAATVVLLAASPAFASTSLFGTKAMLYTHGGDGKWMQTAVASQSPGAYYGRLHDSGYVGRGCAWYEIRFVSLFRDGVRVRLTNYYQWYTCSQGRTWGTYIYSGCSSYQHEYIGRGSFTIEWYDGSTETHTQDSWPAYLRCA